jgi:MFS superfamily sulfate permease-like transporter
MRVHLPDPDARAAHEGRGSDCRNASCSTIVITPAMVWGASLATGVVWLVLGLTGMVHRVANLVSRPVVLGIVLGLGLGFMIEGAKMMSQNWWVGGIALLGISMLLTNRVMPAMFLLLMFGAGYTVVSDHTVLNALLAARRTHEINRRILK